MSEKVKLPRDVVTALDRILDGNDKREVFNDFMGDMRGTAMTWEAKTIHEHFKDDMYQLALALVNGYEVKETKQDRVRKVIQDYCNGTAVSNWVIEAIHEIYEGVNT